MKKKKEIEIPKDKYIYQRYNGIITKYIVDNEYYIAVGTGIATKKDETVLLGKVSENIIDLIEVGDIVECVIEVVSGEDDTEKFEVVATGVKDIKGNNTNEIGISGENGINFIPFKSVKKILTKEQFEENCYKIDTKQQS